LLNRRLSDALAHVHETPDQADAYAELAAGYCDYAACDLLDPASARLYLTRACDALEGATALSPARADLWLALARGQRDRGDLTAAVTALNHALTLAPDDPDAALLRMEIAFRARRWDTLRISPDEGQGDSTAMAGTREIFQWWAHSDPDNMAPALSTS